MSEACNYSVWHISFHPASPTASIEGDRRTLSIFSKTSTVDGWCCWKKAETLLDKQMMKHTAVVLQKLMMLFQCVHDHILY